MVGRASLVNDQLAKRPKLGEFLSRNLHLWAYTLDFRRPVKPTGKALMRGLRGLCTDDT